MAEGEVQEDEEPLVCELFCDGERVEEDVANVEAWRHGRVLRVGEESFKVHVNPPSIDSIVLPPRPLLGFPQRPLTALRNAREEDCSWQWFRGRRSEAEEWEWEPIEGAEEVRYEPGPTDLGCRLKVRCVPGRLTPAGADGPDGAGRLTHVATPRESQPSRMAECDGEPMEAETEGVVCEGPEATAGTERHAHTPAFVPAPGLRVVSYNLLASAYADTEYARRRLFPYVSSEWMDTEYRYGERERGRQGGRAAGRG